MLWHCIVMSPSIHFLFSKNISFVESVSSLSSSLQHRSGWTFVIVIGWTVDHCHNVNRALGDSSKGGVVTLLRRRREQLRQDLSRRMGTRYCASYRVWLPGKGDVGMIQFYNILTSFWSILTILDYGSRYSTAQDLYGFSNKHDPILWACWSLNCDPYPWPCFTSMALACIESCSSVEAFDTFDTWVTQSHWIGLPYTVRNGGEIHGDTRYVESILWLGWHYISSYG